MAENKKVIELNSVSINELNLSGKYLNTIMYKPTLSIYIIFFCSIFLLLFVHQLFAILLGIFLAVMSAFVMFGVQDYKVADVYDDGILIYADETGEKGAKINLEDIVEWSVLSNDTASNAIMLKLQDGRTIYKNTFQMNKAYKSLMAVLNGKETRQIEMEKNKNKELVFRNPFKNWFKK